MIPDLSDTEIIAAADAVFAGGERVTPQRVCELLGRGSPQRVGGLLDEWWAQLVLRLQEDNMPGELNHLMGRVWEAAVEAADRAFTEERKALVDEMQRMQQAFEMEIHRIERQRSRERTIFTRKVEKLQMRNEVMHERVQKLRKDLNDSKVTLREASKRLKLTWRNLVYEESVRLRGRSREHGRALELHTLYHELHSLRSSATNSLSTHALEGRAATGNLWNDFASMLAAAKEALEARFEELSLLAIGPRSQLSEKMENDEFSGKVLVLEHMLSQLRLQASEYHRLVIAWDLKWLPFQLLAMERMR